MRDGEGKRGAGQEDKEGERKGGEVSKKVYYKGSGKEEENIGM